MRWKKNRKQTPAWLASAAGAVVLTTGPALAVAQTPSVTGNYWVAMGILAGLIGLIFLTVVVSLGLFRRDAERGTRDDGGLGLFGSDDD